MKFLNFFIFIFILVFFIFAISIFSDNKSSMITGDIPFTGVLKEGPVKSFISPNMSVSFSMKKKDIYKIRDIEYSLKFVPKNEVKTVVNIDYIITNSLGDIEFYDEDSFVVQGESLIEGNLDRRKAKDIVLDDGFYTFSLIVSYENEEKTFSEKFNLKKVPEWLYSLKQLLDIKMEVDENVIDNPKDLTAKVIFTNFGNESTVVHLTFFIYDINGKEISKKYRNITVKTDNVLFENFENFDVLPGEYLLVLRTVYNVDVEDYFEQKITVKKSLDLLPFFVAGGILLAGGLVFFLLNRKK